jgi:hypothetical protein
MMKDAQVVRDHIDNVYWLLSLNSVDAFDRVLAYVEDIRRMHGEGWWSATLERAENQARMALGQHVDGCPHCGRPSASKSSNLCGLALMGRRCS